MRKEVNENQITDLAIYADKCLRRRNDAYKARKKVFDTFGPSEADMATATKGFNEAARELTKARAKLRYVIRKFHPEHK